MVNKYRDVIEWLESPEGGEWSRRAHNVSGPATLLLTIKDDYWDLPSVILWMYQADPERIKESVD